MRARENECQISENYILHMKFSEFYLCFHNSCEISRTPMRNLFWCYYRWLINLTSTQTYLKCVLVRKCLRGIAHSYLLSEFRHARLFHGYNTRSRDLLRPPFAKTTKYQGSFRINGARTYNTLPRIIRQVETLSEFKIKLKRHFKQ